MTNLFHFPSRSKKPHCRSCPEVTSLTDGLGKSRSSHVIEWVIYDDKEQCVYLRRKMSWGDAAHELRVLLEPYSPDHEWSSRLSVKYWGPTRFPKGMVAGAEKP